MVYEAENHSFRIKNMWFRCCDVTCFHSSHTSSGGFRSVLLIQCRLQSNSVDPSLPEAHTYSSTAKGMGALIREPFTKAVYILAGNAAFMRISRMPVPSRLTQDQ
ncbi:hypothetical protein BJX65DRAFT_191393 [Aspergillus insuetus]